MCAQYEAGFFASLTKVVVELLSDAFPELAGNAGTGMTPEKVAEVILDEEVRLHVGSRQKKYYHVIHMCNCYQWSIAAAAEC
jgi:hypothetical protein